MMCKMMYALISLNGGQKFQELNGEWTYPIFGVDGRLLNAKQYHHLGIANFKVNLTPPEVGASLSHLAALRSFIQSDNAYIVTFEDDVTIDWQNLNKILASLPTLKPDFVHLGGLNGLKEEKIFADTGSCIQTLSLMQLRSLWRACGYILSRRAAELIIERQETQLVAADSWFVLLRSSNKLRMFMSKCVEHPIILDHSTIEKGRRRSVVLNFRKIAISRVYYYTNVLISKIVPILPKFLTKRR